MSPIGTGFNQKKYTDLAICLLFIVLLTFLSGVFDLSEKWLEFSEAHEDWELDEVLIGSAAAALAFFWYSIRRMMEANREAHKRHQMDMDLRNKRQSYEKHEAVGQLTSGVAHEFNNIMAVVSGNAEILAENSEKNPHAAAILRASNRAAELTQQLLSFSQRQQLFVQQIDLAEFFSAFLKDYEKSGGKKFKISLDLIDADMVISADKNQLKKSILNILKNVEDFSPSCNEINILCQRLTSRDIYKMIPGLAGKGCVMISISDNGEGMSEETARRAFEPFFTTKDVNQGQGLGLSMVLGFLQQSGGFADLLSEKGIGTTVRLYFPEDTSPK